MDTHGSGFKVTGRTPDTSERRSHFASDFYLSVRDGRWLSRCLGKSSLLSPGLCENLVQTIQTGDWDRTRPRLCVCVWMHAWVFISLSEGRRPVFGQYQVYGPFISPVFSLPLPESRFGGMRTKREKDFGIIRHDLFSKLKHLALNINNPTRISASHLTNACYCKQSHSEQRSPQETAGTGHEVRETGKMICLSTKPGTTERAVNRIRGVLGGLGGRRGLKTSNLQPWPPGHL